MRIVRRTDAWKKGKIDNNENSYYNNENSYKDKSMKGKAEVIECRFKQPQGSKKRYKNILEYNFLSKIIICFK